MTDERTRQEILERERRRFAALERGDTAFLTEVLGDDLIYTHSSAAVDTKASILDRIASGHIKYDRAAPEDLAVSLYGEVAVITGSARMGVQIQGKPAAFGIRFTDVYVKRPAGWQMVAWQATRLPE
jgi:ketosteroid isomerase-like protein